MSGTVALLRLSDDVFLSQRRPLCGPTDPKAARTCSTSSRGKRTGLLLTPPWKAPTQVGPGGPGGLSAPSESRRGTGVRNWQDWPRPAGGGGAAAPLEPEPGQAMNYSCSGAEWNKGSEDNIGRVFGCLAVKISFLLLLLLYVVFLLLFFYAN